MVTSNPCAFPDIFERPIERPASRWRNVWRAERAMRLTCEACGDEVCTVRLGDVWHAPHGCVGGGYYPSADVAQTAAREDQRHPEHAASCSVYLGAEPLP